MDREQKRIYDQEYFQKHKERILARHKKWRKKFGKEFEKRRYKKNKDKRSLSRKKYYLKNKEKVLRKSKEYRQKNKEKYKTYQKKYYQNNKEKNRERRFANYYKEILKKSKCEKCGSKENLEFHHLNYKRKTFDVMILCMNCHKKEHRKKEGD